VSSAGSSHVKSNNSYLYWHAGEVAKLLSKTTNLSDKNNHLEKILMIAIFE
jgi:hypothetical protein